MCFKIKKNMKTLRKNLKQFGQKHMHVFNIRTKFQKQMTLCVVYTKKTKSVAEMRFENTFFKPQILSFLHRPQNLLFPSKIFTSVEYLYMFVPNLFLFYLTKCDTSSWLEEHVRSDKSLNMEMR